MIIVSHLAGTRFLGYGPDAAIRLIRLILSIRGYLNTAILIASWDRGSRRFHG